MSALEVLIYWVIILGVAAGGTAATWVFFRRFNKPTANGRPCLSPLLRVIRSGAIALFVTPSLAGFVPCPYILAITWAIVILRPKSPDTYLGQIAWTSKVYVVGWAVVYFLIEGAAYYQNLRENKVSQDT